MDIGGDRSSGSTDASGGIYRWDTHQSQRKSEEENEAGSAGSGKTLPIGAADGGERRPGTCGKKPLDDRDEPPETGGKKRDNTSKKKQTRKGGHPW